MNKKIHIQLTEVEVDLLLTIISQSELFHTDKIESVKDYYKMSQAAAKAKATAIMKKLDHSMCKFNVN